MTKITKRDILVWFTTDRKKWSHRNPSNAMLYRRRDYRVLVREAVAEKNANPGRAVVAALNTECARVRKALIEGVADRQMLIGSYRMLIKGMREARQELGYCPLPGSAIGFPHDPITKRFNVKYLAKARADGLVFDDVTCEFPSKVDIADVVADVGRSTNGVWTISENQFNDRTIFHFSEPADAMMFQMFYPSYITKSTA